jgi:hypothetical protein
MEKLAQEDAKKNMAFWYEMAVDEQKREQRDYKKSAKAQEVNVPLTIVEDLSLSA